MIRGVKGTSWGQVEFPIFFFSTRMSSQGCNRVCAGMGCKSSPQIFPGHTLPLLVPDVSFFCLPVLWFCSSCTVNPGTLLCFPLRVFPPKVLPSPSFPPSEFSPFQVFPLWVFSLQSFPPPSFSPSKFPPLQDFPPQSFSAPKFFSSKFFPSEFSPSKFFTFRVFPPLSFPPHPFLIFPVPHSVSWWVNPPWCWYSLTMSWCLWT